MIRRIRRLLGLGLLAAAVAVWVVALRPQALGGPALYIVVRGSSMLPTFETGDLVVLQSASSYAVSPASTCCIWACRKMPTISRIGAEKRA